MAETREVVKDFGYIQATAKTDFAYQKLAYCVEQMNRSETQINAMPDGAIKDFAKQEYAKLEEEYRETVTNPILCFSEEETQSRMQQIDGLKDIFSEIMETTDSQEIAETAQDMKYLQASVEDGKMNFETTLDRTMQELEKTGDMISLAEQANEEWSWEKAVEGPPISASKLIANDAEKKAAVEMAEVILNDVMKNSKYKPKSAEEIGKEYIGKHPVRYALFAAKEQTKAIMNEISSARKYVKKTEGTFLDSLASTAVGLKKSGKAAAVAVLETCKSVAQNSAYILNAAYEGACDVLESAKTALGKVAANVLEKTDVMLEFVTLGGYSEALSSMGRKAAYSENAEKQTLGDRIAQKLMSFHAKTRGFDPDKTSDYIQNIKTVCWGDEAKSPVNYVQEKVNEAKFALQNNATHAAMAVDNMVSLSKTAVGNLKQAAMTKADDICAFGKNKIKAATDSVGNFLGSAKDKASYAATMGALHLAKAGAEFDLACAKANVRLMERAHDVCLNRLDKVLDKAANRINKVDSRQKIIGMLAAEKAALQGQMDDIENATRRVEPYQPSSDMQAALDTLKQIDNPDRSAAFAQHILEGKIAREKAFHNFRESAGNTLFNLSKNLDKMPKHVDESMVAAMESLTQRALQKELDALARTNDKLDRYAERSMVLSERIVDGQSEISAKAQALEEVKKSISELRQGRGGEDIGDKDSHAAQEAVATGDYDDL